MLSNKKLMKKVYSVLIIACLATVGMLGQTQEVMLSPSKDNSIYEEGELSNGAGQYLFTGRTLQDNRRRALLKFDLSEAIPEGITVDSATLINKGLEIIEAHWLFDMPFDRIDVVVHPQSIVHSFVEFIDGSIIAQMGDPDMRYPILYALTYPDRCPSSMRSDITGFPELTFGQVDHDRYPCFRLARRAADAGGTAPTILNAANEMAVGAFLAGKLEFGDIHSVIEGALDALDHGPVGNLEDIVNADTATRKWLQAKYSFGTVDIPASGSTINHDMKEK